MLKSIWDKNRHFQIFFYDNNDSEMITAIFILEEPKINSNEIGIYAATHYTIFMTPFCLIRCRLATPAQIPLLVYYYLFWQGGVYLKT